MALVDVEESKIGLGKGMERKVSKSAEKLILDTIQINQYVKPEESTVRELTSNAVDSQQEKERSIKILKGEAKPEDYYVQREGDKYEDSKFDSTYYDLNHLDTENNNVKLIYKENEGIGYCDRFHVIDHGVGLGDKRLEGIFSVGYSSKRNSVSQLGGFGFGAKVGLSLRNDYYSMITIHNGRKFSFNCYSYKIDSLIGKFNKEGKSNKFITFSDGYKVYYEDTSEKNYTEIIVPTKRIHRDRFRQAIRAQLLYFNNVVFGIHRESGHVDNIDFLAKVQYNSENIIISDNNQFSRPHIVVVKGNDLDSTTGVCYGLVDFKELELEDLSGNVGFKCPIRSVYTDENGVETVLQEGVTVTPSRESVVWSDETREFITRQFSKVVDEATALVDKELVETDFISWVYKAAEVMTRSSDSGILSRMAKIIDMGNIKPKYKPNPKIKFNIPNKLFWGFSVRAIKNRYNYSKSIQEVEREPISHWYEFLNKPVYIQESNTSNIKDKYLLSKGNEFITIRLSDIDKLIEEDVQLKIKSKEKIEDKVELRDAIWGYIKSSAVVINYDDVEVPDDFISGAEIEEEAQKHKNLTPAESRELNAQIVVHSYGYEGYYGLRYSKQEPKLSDIKSDPCEVIYGVGDDVGNINLLSSLLVPQVRSMYSDNFKLIRVSKPLKKHFKDRIHVGKYLKDLNDDNKMVIGEKLIKWNTARHVKEIIKHLYYLDDIGFIAPEHRDSYNSLTSYISSNYSDSNYGIVGNKELKGEFTTFCNNLATMQLYVEEVGTKDEEAIKEKSKELFGSDMVRGAEGLDLEVYNQAVKLSDVWSPVSHMLKNINYSSIESDDIVEFEDSLRDYLQLKGIKFA